LTKEEPIQVETRNRKGQQGTYTLYPPNKEKLAEDSEQTRQKNKQFAEHVRKSRIVSEKALFCRITF